MGNDGRATHVLWALPAWVGLLLTVGGGLALIAFAPEPVPHGDLEQRLATWNREVENGAPIGATRSDVDRWKRGAFAEQPQGYTLSAFGTFEEMLPTEALQTRRPRDGCRIWQIWLSINYD